MNFLTLSGILEKIKYQNMNSIVKKVLTWMRTCKIKLFSKVSNFMFEKAEKNRAKIEKYATWGLFLFVAIPLPGTGAWTGTLIASVLGLEPKKSFLAAVLGVLGATTIMTVISYCGLGAIFG